MAHKINLLINEANQVLHDALIDIPIRQRAEFIRMHATFSILSASKKASNSPRPEQPLPMEKAPEKAEAFTLTDYE